MRSTPSDGSKLRHTMLIPLLKAMKRAGLSSNVLLIPAFTDFALFPSHFLTFRS